MSANTHIDFDILIVGGGMVGGCIAALAANESALSDARIAVLEPQSMSLPPPDDDVDLRVSAVSRASERILTRAAAWQHIAPQHRCAYEAMTVWDAENKVDSASALHFSAAETGEPNLGHIIENRRVQWALFESSALRQRVTMLNATVQSLDFGDSSEAVTVGLSDYRSLRAGLVIAADGANSPSRKMAGIETSGWAYEQSAVVTHVRTSKPHAHTAWQRFTANGPIAFLPLLDGRCSIVWTNPSAVAERLTSMDAKAFASELTAASDGVLGAVEVTSPRARFPLHLLHAREYTRPRFALVGDAAHAVHPLAGQGVNLGFMDGAALVETLVAARTQGATLDQLAESRVLRRYERWRKSENAIALGLIDGINRLFSNDSALLGAVRRTGFAAIERVPQAKRFLIMRALGLAGERPAMTRSAY